MSRLDDELKQALRRKEPPADFAARVLDRIQQDAPHATVHHMPVRAVNSFPRLLAIAATIALMILAGVLWFVVRRQQGAQPSTPVMVKEDKPARKDKEERAAPVDKPLVPEDEKDEQRAYQPVKRKLSPRKAPRVNVLPREKTFAPDAENFLALESPSDFNFSVDDETARHLRKAQLLLRSFRNTEFAASDSPVDISYEKQLSRELLNDNMLFRREAETRKNLPVKEVLSSLEPFLLDIANLGAQPSPDEMRQIKERMRRKEIVAELQVYTARAATVAVAGFR